MSIFSLLIIKINTIFITGISFLFYMYVTQELEIQEPLCILVGGVSGSLVEPPKLEILSPKTLD